MKPTSTFVPVISLLPGDCAVSRGDQAFSTLLGSCVAACIYDTRRGIGGMNHFMLPQSGSLDPITANWEKSARFGNYAMELLINRAMALGAERRDLVAKLFGGSTILIGVDSNIGSRNIEFAMNYLRIESIPMVAGDLGGSFTRKIRFDPASGQVTLKRIRHTSSALIQRETTLARQLQKEDPEGDVTFF